MNDRRLWGFMCAYARIRAVHALLSIEGTRAPGGGSVDTPARLGNGLLFWGWVSADDSRTVPPRSFLSLTILSLPFDPRLCLKRPRSDW